jgi:hypothetical protein
LLFYSHIFKTIPKQVIIYTTKGSNNKFSLPLGTSLYDLKQAKSPAVDELEQKNGLRVFVLEAAGLIPASALAGYRNNAVFCKVLDICRRA